MDAVKTHDTGLLKDRSKTFKKLLFQVKKYRLETVDPHLQAISILNLCADIQLKKSSIPRKQLLQAVKMFGGYVPMDPETDLSIALKLCNKLCLNLDETFFAATMERAKELELKVHTTRKPAEAEIDLSDEDEVPLATAAQFTSHKSILIDDKDGLQNHLQISDRITALAKERGLIREWKSDITAKNSVVAAGVVFAYARKDVKGLPPAKIQQYLCTRASRIASMRCPS